jgi:riboflavin-specific deaminase-like protein
MKPHLSINMVVTVDGRAAVGGTGAGLGSAADRRLMRELRARADAVMHGAGTLRADRLSPRVPPNLVTERLARGQSAQPLGVIVSGRGDLPADHPYYRSPTVIYRLSDQVLPPPAPGVEVRYVPDVAAMLVDLAGRGIQRIVCEGGPTLHATLLEAGLVDELFLTIAPKLVGGLNPLTSVHGRQLRPVELQLLDVRQIDDELFLHYGIRRSG